MSLSYIDVSGQGFVPLDQALEFWMAVWLKVIFRDCDAADGIVTSKDVMRDVLIKGICLDILLAAVVIVDMYWHFVGCLLQDDRDLAECVNERCGR